MMVGVAPGPWEGADSTGATGRWAVRIQSGPPPGTAFRHRCWLQCDARENGGAKRKCVAVRSQLAANTNCDGTIRDVANIAELPELLRMIMMQGAERRLKVARLSAAH